MAKDKKPDKNNGSKKGTVTCERTYVSDRCSATNQQTRRSPPSSPSTIRVIDLPCRHQRRGAVRDKRTVSLDKPRPAHQRADNAYVETPFVDGVVPLQLQGAPSASCSSSSYGPPNAVSYSYDSTTSAGVSYTELPAIKFAAMRSSSEPPPRPGEGIIDEFPAYVPWKAEQRVEEDSLACNVCHKCRCTTCQKLCKYPGMRVCGVFDVQTRCDEACVETTTVCVPCVQKTARCPAFNAARAEAAARAEIATAAAAARAEANAAIAAARAEAAAAAGEATADEPAVEVAKPEGSDSEPQTERAASRKCRLRWLLCCLCCPCPYCQVNDAAECSAGCRGNVNVSGCECVDWEALRQNNRHRVNAAAAAVAASRDQRRCRDYHYYIKAMPHLANPTAASAVADVKSANDKSANDKSANDKSANDKSADDKSAVAKAAADEENVGTATAEKKSKLRKFLRF